MIMRKQNFPDNAYREIPQEYFSPCAKAGKVEAVNYTAHNHAGNGEEFEKTALVYLPYGYDPDNAEKKYNVMYMMHGGGGTEKELLGGAGMETEMKLILDNMIANSDLEPCLFVGISYNTPYCKDATACCRNFAAELVNDLIPAVEGSYNTYCKTPDSEGIRASRLHRGFGGFSMGSACTWWVFEKALNEIAYFLPTSGDSWGVEMKGGNTKPVETVENLIQSVKNQGMSGDDFYIYCGTGTNDIAYPNMCPMVAEMKKRDDYFRYCDNFAYGNFYFAVKDGGWHDQNTVRSIVFNGLPKFFG